VNFDFSLHRWKAAEVRLLVSGGQHGCHPVGVQMEGCQAGWIQLHFDLPALPAYDAGERDIVQPLHHIFNLYCHPPQGIVVHILTPEGQCQYWNVVDVARLDQRRRHSVRNTIKIGQQLRLQSDNGFLLVLPHVKTDYYQGRGRARSGIDVFDPGNFPEQLLHGLGCPLFNLFGAGSWHADEDIDHGHDNLRILLPREHIDGSQSQED